jgi:hypothetical protein
MAQTSAFAAATGSGATAVPETANPAAYKMTRVINLADTRFFTGGAAINEVLEAIAIPAKTKVLGVVMEVLTVAGAACTCDVGDGTTVGGYLSAFNLNTAANSACSMPTILDAVATGYPGGKYYSAADTVDVKILAANAAAKFKISVLCVPF